MKAMNGSRRQRISTIASCLSELRDELANIAAEESAAFDALNEAQRTSTRGQGIEGNAEILADAVDKLKQVDEYLQELVTP